MSRMFLSEMEMCTMRGEPEIIKKAFSTEQSSKQQLEVKGKLVQKIFVIPSGPASTWTLEWWQVDVVVVGVARLDAQPPQVALHRVHGDQAECSSSSSS